MKIITIKMIKYNKYILTKKIKHFIQFDFSKCCQNVYKHECNKGHNDLRAFNNLMI